MAASSAFISFDCFCGRGDVGEDITPCCGQLNSYRFSPSGSEFLPGTYCFTDPQVKAQLHSRPGPRMDLLLIVKQQHRQYFCTVGTVVSSS